MVINDEYHTAALLLHACISGFHNKTYTCTSVCSLFHITSTSVVFMAIDPLATVKSTISYEMSHSNSITLMMMMMTTMIVIKLM